MKNEKGVIFPITVLFSCLFLSLLLHVLALYEEEIEFAKYEQQSYDVDSLMQMAVKDVNAELEEKLPSISSGKGTFVYPIGTAKYEWQLLSGEKVMVTMSAISNEGIRYEAEFTVSFPGLELVEWKERS
ncbi:competence type IV pilus minor pilin ComGG [Anoxybacteroides tepidamans]|uniref:competence type IV pilus minor pilin ComGG n=1 Tax=Anoxybacteroides tepidamans TaxID=265948 RepID=UPI0004884924|nr:competence type IV pilus minor pilin ComGG [Anoxybacillus tepidamans]